MDNTNTVFTEIDDSLEQKQQTKRLLFRMIPYIPLLMLAILLGIGGSFLYLRYATRMYAIIARVIVNDDSQQKSANLVEILQLDTRNLSAETEKEMQILYSRDLLRNLAQKLQLTVQYSQKGYVKSGQYFNNTPFTLELLQPDSVKMAVSGGVLVHNGKIDFKGILYPVDSLVESDFGTVRWHINPDYKPSTEVNKWVVTIQPISSIIELLKRSLTIKPISKQSSILDLTYIDELPDRGLSVVNNLITLYGTTSVDYKSRVSYNTLRFLDERLRLVSEDLSGVEKKLQEFKTAEGIVDISAEGSLFLSQLKEADTKISELDVQMDVLKQVEQYVAKRNSSNSPIPATLGITDPVLVALLNQLYQSEFDLEKTRQISGSKNPQIEVYEEAISKLKPSILTSINNLKLSISASRQRLQADNDKLNATLTKIPQKERQLLDISRQQGIKNAIYTFLLQKREEAAISAAAILPNYRVIERPENSGLVEPVTQKIYLFGISIALILASLYIYLKEFSSSRLLFRTQIEARVKIPILAELSYQPNDTGNPIVVGQGIRSNIAEQFRELRTNLNYVTAITDEKCKVILTTSSIPGEGKSFVALNTAVSLCLTNARVVLMEFDLRKPKISKPLGIQRDPGLSNYLINSANEQDIIKSHPTIANFKIIPSGPIPPNPSELISSPRLNQLIDYLKNNFDYIILDSPPLGAVTDAKILASIAHTTMYIIRHNYTNSSFLQLLNDVQQKNILPNINIVFNGITTKKILGYSYGEGYGYGYGYGYGSGYGYVESGERKAWWRRIFSRRRRSKRSD